MNEPSYLPYDDVGITIAVIAIALAFIVLVWNAVKAITEWRKMARKPTDDKFEDHEERIRKLENCCIDVQRKLEGDWEFRQDTAEFNQMVLKSIKELLKYEINGEDKSGIIKMENEIENYLIEENHVFRQS